MNCTDWTLQSYNDKKKNPNFFHPILFGKTIEWTKFA